MTRSEELVVGLQEDAAEMRAELLTILEKTLQWYKAYRRCADIHESGFDGEAVRLFEDDLPNTLKRYKT